MITASRGLLPAISLLCLVFVSGLVSAESSIPAAKLWLDVPADLQAPCAPAIADFCRCFQKVTGRELPVAAEADSVPLKLKVLPVDADDTTFLGRGHIGDYEIAVSDKEIVVSGKSPLALTNGLYGLLDSWGCRWAFPGDLGECVPVQPDLQVPLGVSKVKIASDSRLLAGPPSYYNEGEVGDWVRRNRYSKESTVTAHHSWASLIAPAFVHNDPSKPESYHPEYFSLIGGKRLPGIHADKLQICTTNPEVIRLGIEKARKYLRENPGVDTFPCSPEDNFEFCQCEACLAMDTGALTPEGTRNVSDRVMAFANEIARGIRDEFPGKLVGIYAYNNYSLPPTKVPAEKNIMVDLTRANYDQLRLIPRNDQDSSAQFRDLVASWKKVTPYVYLYEYNPVVWSAGLFCPNYLEYANAVRYYRDAGVLGFRSDPGELPFRNKVNFLNDYLSMRVAVDAGLKPEEELSAICRSLYGGAAEPMTQYFQIMSHVVDQDPVPGGSLGFGIKFFNRIFTPEMVKSGGEALARARQSVGPDPAASKRLRMVEQGHRYLTQYLDVIQAAREGDYEKSLKAMALLERTLDTLVANGMFEPLNRAAILRGAAAMAQAEYCPAAAGFVQNWEVLGPLDNSDRTGEVALASYEPVLDPGKAVTLPGGKSLTWRKYHSPTGFLDLYKALGGRPKEWSACTAYAAVRLKAKEASKVRLTFNSFNSFRVYLNGKEVFFRPGQQMDLPDSYGLDADLQAGENVLVFRSTELLSGPAAPWGLYLRVLDPASQGAKPSPLVTLN